jgi:hypothetical protein
MPKLCLPMLLVVLAVASAVPVRAQSKAAIEQEWVETDSINIAKMIALIRREPEKILALDVFSRRDFEDLGYGYSYHETVTEGGYVGTRLQIVLKDGKPVSFAALPRLPYPYVALYDRYRSFYEPLFKFDAAGNPQTFYWNYRAMAAPMGDSSYLLRFQRQILGSPHRDKLELLMTPYAGIEYGCGTHSGNSIPTNRQLFEEVMPAMNYLLATCLLRSINPATRLVAIEYLQRFHTEKYGRKPMQKDIKQIYKRHPKAMTVSGYERRYEDSEALVRRYILEGCQTTPPSEETLVADEKKKSRD